MYSTPIEKTQIVTLWKNETEESIKPKELERAKRNNCDWHFKGWKWVGRTQLNDAIESWKWNQENLNRTFSDSIWIVQPVWIFPDVSLIPSNWMELGDYCMLE